MFLYFNRKERVRGKEVCSEIEEEFGKERVLGRKKKEQDRAYSILLLSHVTEDRPGREVSTKKTMLASQNPCPRMILLKAALPGFELGFIFWQISVWNTPGENVAIGHTSQTGEERQQLFSLLPVVSGQLASPPTMLCICPTSKPGQPSKKRREHRDRIDPPFPTPSPLSLAKMLTSSEHCINICMFRAAARKFSLC